MITANIEDLTLQDMGSVEDTSLQARYNFPISAAEGAANSAVVYFEIEPGKRLGKHHDSVEEVLLIVEGRAHATIGNESGQLEKGGMAVIPAWAAHDVANIGDTTLKVVGFFAGGTVVHAFREPLIPGVDIPVLVHGERGEEVYAGAPLAVPAQR